MFLLLPVFFPLAAGAAMLLAGRRMGQSKKSRALLDGAFLAAQTLETVFIILAAALGGDVTLLSLTGNLTMGLRVDGVGRFFGVLTAVMWFLTAVYAVSYLKEDGHAAGFYGFYLMVPGALMGLDFAADLLTFYVFFELMTLTSLPLVLHERTKEAVRAGLKYLFYSVGGAFLALFGIFYLAQAAGSLTFLPGGYFTAASAASAPLLLPAALCMIVGFGAKAGMFPLHGWLPVAHPAAPAPASAVLSGVITKAGVLAIVRSTYDLIGPAAIRGTWVQSAWLILSLLTVFLGSMLAYREPVFKKRLAYSTVSQVSYVLFGLGLMDPLGFTGALAHVAFHSVIKTGLFLFAGAVIRSTGRTRAEELRGLGRIMPVSLGAYTAASLALIGIPPASGFISKWYLAQGALASDTGVFRYLGPAVLLLSALLTAGYLLPPVIAGFFPGKESEGPALISGEKPPAMMALPILLLGAAAVLLGCFPGPLLGWIGRLAEAGIVG